MLNVCTLQASPGAIHRTADFGVRRGAGDRVAGTSLVIRRSGWRLGAVVTEGVPAAGRFERRKSHATSANAARIHHPPVIPPSARDISPNWGSAPLPQRTSEVLLTSTVEATGDPTRSGCDRRMQIAPLSYSSGTGQAE